MDATPAAPRVLLVDDEEGIRSAFTRILSNAGFTVEAVESGSAALDLLRKQRAFDAVVTDLKMPGLNGMDLLRLVRQFDEDLPLIVATGCPTLVSAISTVEMGGFRYLVKPVSADELRDTVRSAAAKHRLAMLKRHALKVCETERWHLDQRVGLDVAFKRALEKLWIAYQPIIDWSAGRVFGYEALVRTRDTAFSGPSELFDAAGRLGRTADLGRTIRARVSESIATAPESALLFVNVHAGELSDSELYSKSSPLSAHAERVVLEVTERSPLDEITDLNRRMTALRNLGFRIAVDDLGAGYAGLSAFSILEPEIVKFDMSLTRDVDRSPQKQSLIRSMISVCENELGTLVVCEGVETIEERETLVQLGGSLFQGYFFARPDPTFLQPAYCGLPGG